MFSEFLHTHRLILYPPADAPAAVVSITQTMIQNSRLQNASWYVLKLANPDDFVTWNDSKQIAWPENNDRSHFDVLLHWNLTIPV